MVYYGREELDSPPITINGDVVERVSCAKLLGVLIMSNLSWEDHIANLVSMASRRLHLLRDISSAHYDAHWRIHGSTCLTPLLCPGRGYEPLFQIRQAHSGWLYLSVSHQSYSRGTRACHVFPVDVHPCHDCF